MPRQPRKIKKSKKKEKAKLGGNKTSDDDSDGSQDDEDEEEKKSESKADKKKIDKSLYINMEVPVEELTSTEKMLLNMATNTKMPKFKMKL